MLHAASAHGEVAAAIARAAETSAGDLIVIGAYSHSRPTELIFGGMTRTLLKYLPIPLFVSR
ncbi:universal stress protein [Pseudomonas silvicola]|nr:universal stress protein [Pseudomonas silvicola]